MYNILCSPTKLYKYGLVLSLNTKSVLLFSESNYSLLFLITGASYSSSSPLVSLVSLVSLSEVLVIAAAAENVILGLTSSINRL